MTERTDKKSHVRIHIDQAPHDSLNPTTGDALYALGHIAPEAELFREVRGDREDEAIPRGSKIVHLKEDEHFHSGSPKLKSITIIVNGRPKKVTGDTITFEAVVALAFQPVPTGPNILFSMTYEHGPNQNREGMLSAGKSVFLKNGMIFNVTYTDKS